MSEFEGIWKKFLAGTSVPVDILASINETGLNSVLKTHFKKDKRYYSFSKEFTFDTGAVDRKFKLMIKANNPMELDIAPFGTLNEKIWKNNTGWYIESNSSTIGLPPEPDLIGLHSENARLRMKDISVVMYWDKLQGAGQHKFQVNVTALAKTALVLDKDPDGRPQLSLKANGIRFTQERLTNMRVATASLVKKISKDNPKVILSNTDYEVAFQDLFVIVSNILAHKYVPRSINGPKIPIFDIANNYVIPSNFAADNNNITVGYGLNRNAIQRELETYYERAFRIFDAAMEADIEKAGSLENIFYSSSNRTLAEAETPTARSKKEIEEGFKNTNDAIRKLTNIANDQVHKLSKSKEKSLLKESKKLEKIDFNLSPRFGVAINEYILDTLIRGIDLEPRKERCTKWLKVAAVKGRGCYWTELRDPDIKISGDATTANVTGSIHVDTGAKIEACVKKFWDCSWKWVCGEIGLGLKGRGQIKFKLDSTTSGVAISAKIEKLPQFDTKLPYPFNKIINAVLNLMLKGIKAIINLALSMIKLQLVRAVYKLPDQNTIVIASAFRTGILTLPNSTQVSERQKFLAIGAIVHGA